MGQLASELQETLLEKHGADFDIYFVSTVAGVSHDGRQALVSRMKSREILTFRRDSANKFDRHAVAVYRDYVDQVGYLKADVALRVASDLDEGRLWLGFVLEVTEPDENVRFYGVLMLVARISDAGEKRLGLNAKGLAAAREIALARRASQF